MKTPQQIKTWEDVCEGLQIDPVKSLEFLQYMDADDREHHEFDFKLKKLAKLAWGNVEADFRKGRQEKWFPLFNGNLSDKPSGFGFLRSHSYYGHTCTVVGARLSYPSEAWADCAGREFEDWYRKAYVVVK